MFVLSILTDFLLIDGRVNGAAQSAYQCIEHMIKA